MIRPPAMSSVMPVSHDAESDTRNSVASAQSSGVPMLPSGDIAATFAVASSSMMRAMRSELTVAGAIALTRMP